MCRNDKLAVVKIGEGKCENLDRKLEFIRVSSSFPLPSELLRLYLKSSAVMKSTVTKACELVER